MTSPDEPGWIGSASRQAALPAPLRELHRAVLRRFLAAGAVPHVTFHASRDSARAYLAARVDIDGEILDQQAAVDSGRRNFGPLLGGMT